MTFEAIPDLLADILEQQRKTTDAIIGLAEALAGARAKAIETTKADKPKAEPKADAGKPAAAAPSAESQAPSAAAATTAEFPSEPVADAPAIAIADVNAAIIALAKAKGRDAAVAVLGTFGVAKAPELKAEQYADVVAAAKKAMA
jgi:hypothetical protein